MRAPGALRRQLRLAYIGYVLATHGMAAVAVRLRLFRLYAWLVYLFQRERLPRELGGQIRTALERLGPTFIKFGQMLSTRTDLLPVEIAAELKKLQDAVPPAPFAEVRAMLERAYKRPLVGEGGAFASFDPQPVAAASIAQVHFATLPDGRKVAVKVRRPNIERVIEDDLALLKRLAELVERYVPEWRRLKPREVVEEFARTIRAELNLRAEGAHAERFAENLADVPYVRIPRVVWDWTKPVALVTERIDGIPIDEVQALKEAGHDTLKLCERLATLFFHMVFVDGYFHADMHPGNIFVAADGALVLVDFGIVGRVPMRTRRYLAEMLVAFLERDYRRAALVHLRAGYVPPDTDISAFEDALREIAAPIFNRPLGEISIAELLGVMFSVTERFRMETRPELLLLQKTMLTIEGIARELA
ncbi:MAG: 2-polyprenylphenol 6-hydroxylase, partial [Zetaproteobacteria bacterium]